jgi:hypothetical protein
MATAYNKSIPKIKKNLLKNQDQQNKQKYIN